MKSQTEHIVNLNESMLATELDKNACELTVNNIKTLTPTDRGEGERHTWTMHIQYMIN